VKLSAKLTCIKTEIIKTFSKNNFKKLLKFKKNIPYFGVLLYARVQQNANDLLISNMRLVAWFLISILA
jgi:hypothetical protein